MIGSGGELLGHRTESALGLGGIGNIVLPVGRAVSLGQQDIPTLGDQDASADQIIIEDWLQERIHLGLQQRVVGRPGGIDRT